MENLTEDQKHFIVNCFRVIDNTSIDNLKASGYFDDFDADKVYQWCADIENILMAC